MDELVARILSGAGGENSLLNSLALQRGSFADNLLNPSEGVGSWATTQATLSDAAAKDPTNGFFGASMIEVNSNSYHLADSAPIQAAVAVKRPKAAALFYKPLADLPRNRIYLAYQDSGGHFVEVDFNVLTGERGDVYGSGEFEVVEAYVEPAANGWARYCIGVVPNATPTAFGSIYFGFEDDTGAKSYQGDGVSGGYLFGFQLEDGVTRVSPYKTTPFVARGLVLTPYADLLRYVYDLAAYAPPERKRRFG